MWVFFVNKKYSYMLLHYVTSAERCCHMHKPSKSFACPTLPSLEYFSSLSATHLFSSTLASHYSLLQLYHFVSIFLADAVIIYYYYYYVAYFPPNFYTTPSAHILCWGWTLLIRHGKQKLCKGKAWQIARECLSQRLSCALCCS